MRIVQEPTLRHRVNTPWHLPDQPCIIVFMSYQSVNPSNGKVLKKFKELSDAPA